MTERRNKEIILEHIRLNYLVDIKVKMLGRQLHVFGVQEDNSRILIEIWESSALSRQHLGL